MKPRIRILYNHHYGDGTHHFLQVMDGICPVVYKQNPQNEYAGQFYVYWSDGIYILQPIVSILNKKQ